MKTWYRRLGSDEETLGGRSWSFDFSRFLCLSVCWLELTQENQEKWGEDFQREEGEVTHDIFIAINWHTNHWTDWSLFEQTSQTVLKTKPEIRLFRFSCSHHLTSSFETNLESHLIKVVNPFNRSSREEKKLFFLSKYEQSIRRRWSSSRPFGRKVWCFWMYC